MESVNTLPAIIIFLACVALAFLVYSIVKGAFKAALFAFVVIVFALGAHAVGAVDLTELKNDVKEKVSDYIPENDYIYPLQSNS